MLHSGRKKVLLLLLGLLAIYVYISFNFHRTNKFKDEHRSILVRKPSKPILPKDREELLRKGCHSTRLNFSHNIRSSILNYLGFVLRSNSIFYCSVPKVATRTLLPFITYLHVRDDLIPRVISSNLTIDVQSLKQVTFSSTENISLVSPSETLAILRKFLSVLEKNASKVDLWSMYQRRAFPLIRPRTLSNPSILHSPNFTRVIFVRHPLERLASAYVDKITSLKNVPFTTYDNLRRTICRKYASFYLTREQRKFHRRNRKASKQREEPCERVIPRFEHFLEYLMFDSFRTDVHWQPYSKLCEVCSLKYNFIGKYETISDDLKRLTNSFSFGNDFATGKSKDNYRSLYTNLSDQSICFLKDFYKDDLKLFQYRFEDYVDDRTTPEQCSQFSWRGRPSPRRNWRFFS